MIATALRLRGFVLLAFWFVVLLRLIKSNILGGSVEADIMLAGYGRGKAIGVDRTDRGAGNRW